MKLNPLREYFPKKCFFFLSLSSSTQIKTNWQFFFHSPEKNVPYKFQKYISETIQIITFSHSFFVLSFQPENCLSSYNPHGYCVIYSSADRSSFVIAERIIQALWTSENIAQRAVILVGNKADLARSRVITSEGKLKLSFWTYSARYAGLVKGNLFSIFPSGS